MCPAFVQGYCSRGTTCPYKHYTLRMVREERLLGVGKSKAGSSGVVKKRSRKTMQGNENQQRKQQVSFFVFRRVVCGDLRCKQYWLHYT